MEDIEAKPAHKNVYVALAAAQAEMGPMVKGSVNPAFRSKYADLSDLVVAVRGPLTSNGLAYFHRMMIGEAGRDMMETVLVHGESETFIECPVPLIVAKNDMQGMKSATTYAKRIGLESVTGIAPEDDDGNAAAKAPPKDEDRKPSGPTAMEVAIGNLSIAAGLDQLAAIWKDLPKSVQGEKAVFAAKEKRKTELHPPVKDDLDGATKSGVDLGGDHIPY